MLTVSNYHYIREDFSAQHPSIFGVTPDAFRKQLEELSKHGNFISQDQLLKHIEKPFEKNYILITFDDGLKEQFQLAKPILDQMGIPAIFFVNSFNFVEKKVSLVHKIHLIRSELPAHEIIEELENRGFTPLTDREKALATGHYNYDNRTTAFLKYLFNFKMSPIEQEKVISPLFEKLFSEENVNSKLYFETEMLQQLHTLGYLGSHSHHHLPLAGIGKGEVIKDLENAQDFFKKTFGKKSEAISYPYGSFEACTGISEEVENAGFKLGFTMERAVTKSIQEDSLLISRFDCNDLPLGKQNLFNGRHLFDNPTERRWHLYENSSTNKRQPTS